MGRFRGLAAALGAVALATGCGRTVTVMSYNVGNLFDTAADGTEYADAGTPGEEAFRRKCSSVAGAIRRSVLGGPDIVALQEVENLGVLLALRDGWLRGLGYRYYVVAGGPPSATRVGFLSRLPIVRARSHLPAPPEEGGMQRAMLEIECPVGGAALHVLNAHWKSKIGGTRETEAARLQAARAAVIRVRGIAAQDPGAETLVVGDLNEDHDDPRQRAGDLLALSCVAAGGSPAGHAGVILLTGDPAELARDEGPLTLYEPWLEQSAPAGSYAYGERWYTPDHVLLGPGLFDERELVYRRGSFRVAAAPFLLDERTGFPKGYGGRAGEYSDHLPLLVTLERRAPTAPARAPRG